MLASLPRVTYSNAKENFASVHAMVDRDLPIFTKSELGRRRGNCVGAMTQDEDGVLYTVASPIDRDIVVGEFVEASSAAVDRAVEGAHQAARTWGALPWQTRLVTIRHWGEIVAARKYELAFAALMEIGKSRLEAIGEAEEAVDIISYYSDQMEENKGFERRMREALPGESTKSILRPLGVFAIISPFNFPLALVLNPLVAALVAGNSVVLKPSPGCGLTGRLIIDTLLAAGVPPGVVNLINGSDEVGRQLVRHPKIQGVAFVGSNQAGMSIYRQIARDSKFARPVIAEMGGKNPAYVTSSADISIAASGVARSAFGLQGQKCSACSVAYVDERVKDRFIDALTSLTATLAIGDPRAKEVFMGPIYSADAATRYSNAIAEVRSAGRVIVGGERLAGGIFDKGHYLPPTVVELTQGGRLTRDELFMPFLVIRSFQELNRAIDEGNQVDAGLAAGIYTSDKEELQSFLSGAQAGVLYANRASGATTGAWPGIQSFCGWKGSGTTNKGGLGPHFLPQFMREQSHTIVF